MNIMVDYFTFITSKIIKCSLNVYEINQINILRYFKKYYFPCIMYFLTFSRNVPSTLKVFPLLTILTL